MRKYVPHFLFVLLIGGAATASAIKVWTTGETLRAADLNSNFAHIHNTKVGDGILLVNADVSASAAISHAKLATPLLVPKVVGRVRGAAIADECTANPCTVVTSSGISGVAWTGTGAYTVTVSTARSLDAVVIATAMTGGDLCFGSMATTTTASVSCSLASTGAVSDAKFAISIWDN